MGRRALGWRPTIGSAASPARRPWLRYTSDIGNSIAETPRLRPNRECERARGRRSETQPRAVAGGYAGFSVLPVIEVGRNLRAHLNELKLRLDPVHRMPPFQSSACRVSS